MITRRSFVIGSTVLLGSPAWAALPYWSTRKTGFAVDGADTVSYFQLEKKRHNPLMGVNKYQTTWKGGKWRFANANNLKLFKAAPEKYAPQFGGYCSLSVANGGNSTGGPEAWDIYKDKLYLNYDKSVRSRWRRNKSGNIRLAKLNWPQVLEV